MKFGFGIPLHVEDDNGGLVDDLFESVDRVAEALSDLEDCTPSLLDSSLSADRSTGAVLVEVTIEADSVGQGLDLALGCVRTAIHAAGESTPDWEHVAPHIKMTGEYTTRDLLSV